MLSARATLAQPTPDLPTTGTRHVELLAERSAEPPEVRVSPGVATVLLFDLPPSRIEVAHRERFRAVGVDGPVLTLVPSEPLSELEQVRLTAHFADGAAPTSTTFLLRVVPQSLAERQVEVHRRPRSLESYQQELLQLRVEHQRCIQELERQRLSPAQEDALAHLLVAKHLTRTGVTTRDVVRELIPHPRNALKATEAWTYRAAKRVAVALEVTHLGAQRWQMESASLEDKTGTPLRIVRVWQQATGVPDEPGHIVVEAEAKPTEAQGPFTLSLLDTEGQRTVILGNVMFP
nr:DUF2381 family protein [Pyxidicoccus fallax]